MFLQLSSNIGTNTFTPNKKVFHVKQKGSENAPPQSRYSHRSSGRESSGHSPKTGSRDKQAVEMSAVSLKTFLYFAYGSNLLAERILLQNPTAVRRGIGKLDNYRLDFNRFASRWGGCSATIVQDPGKHVWGAVWEIEKSQMESLDRQEGVKDHVYTPLQVDVVTPSEQTLECRVYRLIDEPRPYLSAQSLPEERRPSRVYLETILQGAVESGLPEDYIQFLKSFPHNGFSGPVDVPGLNITFTLTPP